MLILTQKKKPTDSIECWTAVRWATVDVVEKPPPPILGFPNCHWLGNEKFTCLLVWLHWRTTTCTSCHTQDTNICIRTASGSCKCNLFCSTFYHVFRLRFFFWNVSGPMPVVTFFFGLPIPAFHITRASMGETTTINDGPTSTMDEPINSPAQPLRIDWSLASGQRGQRIQTFEQKLTGRLENQLPVQCSNHPYSLSQEVLSPETKADWKILDYI